MSGKNSKYIGLIHFLGDLLLLNFAFALAYWIKFNGLDNYFVDPYLSLLLFYNGSWLVLLILTNPYQFSRISRVTKIIRMHLSLVTLHLLFVAAFFVFEKAYYYSREHILLTYTIFTVLLFLWKTTYVYTIRIYRKSGFNYRNVVIVGYGELSEELNKFFRLHPEHGYRLLGFFDNKKKGKAIKGNFKDLKTFAIENEIDEIYCCLPYIRYTQVKDLIDFGDDHLIKVKLIADFRGFSLKSLVLERYDHIPVLNVSSIPLDEFQNRIIKRTFDVVFSGMVILFILSWLLPLIAIIVKLDSKGPIFFKQKRTGKGNESFYCYKFRSMTVNTDSDTMQASKNDQRITKVGAFLRRSSLDELPQFFNVFLGHMSVVGPRPHMLKHTEEYSKLVSKFMARHFVKPGITGLAQAKGFRGETKSIDLMKNRVRLDRFYVENWSLNFDIRIIILTILAMLKGDKNAF